MRDRILNRSRKGRYIRQTEVQTLARERVDDMRGIAD
jgi:hypothetical protein